MDISEAEDGLLLDLAEHGEQRRLHPVTVQGVFSSLRVKEIVKIVSLCLAL